eukprot:TRINITY_DN2744_c0_g1_i1.p2 TRINITY_DN2744_c0_g1~~TRINITY_DN2744_c0_g1_i1.p2  ORF type:complete len:502 (-),score=111.75 TRINITY_DN2744_c0_g1_i1:5112-6617(-)
MPNARQSDLPNRPTYLPPLSPSATSHPHHATGVPPRQSYPVKLSADTVNALLNGEDAFIEFTHDEQGKIYIPNRPDITFTTRAITADNADTSRAALFSRRGSNLRLVGPINHEMEIDRFPNQRSHHVKKRAVNARSAVKREVKPLEDAADATTAKPRARKSAEKRPRAAPRRPPATASAGANGNSANFRVPRSLPLTQAALRSAPASPTENGRQPAAKRVAAASRSSMGSLGARRISPPANTPLPKPVARQTPTKTRVSPHSNSRGPSPGVHSPSSARAHTRAQMDNLEDVRRHVVHSLALGDMTMAAIRRRHEARNMESNVLDDALGEVAEKSGVTYRLKKRSWREVYDDYTDYSDMERKMMTQNRQKVGAVDGKLAMEVMNDDLLNHEVRDVAKLMSRSVAEAKDEEGDDRLRKSYEQVHRIYSEVIERISAVAVKMRRLGDRLETCNESERGQVCALIDSANQVHGERYSRFKRALPKMHGYLKQVRRAVEKYERWDE